MPHLLALGLGYSVSPLVNHLVARDWDVTGTTRSEEKAERFKAKGITPLLWAAPDPLPEQAVAAADVIVISVSPDDQGCPAARAVPVSALKPGARLLYLSSTGVYGDAGGDWVDEETPCDPGTERGKKRLVAEGDWQRLAKAANARLTICRLAGIYGPGRNAVESLKGETNGSRAGLSRRIIKPGQVFNRIHQEDIAGGLNALIRTNDPPDIVNFADDEPSPPQDVIEYAAKLIGIDPPPEVPFEEAEMSPMARSFYADNKRLRNDRLKALPGFRLKFPTYREGVGDIASE